MRRRTSILCSLLALSLVSGLASSAVAQERSLDEGPIVRRQLLYRSDRLELAPSIGHTLNDPYLRHLFVNLGINYHLTNTFSLGLTAGWGGIQYNSNILDEIEATQPSIARDLDFAETTLLANFHLGWVPYYGKFNFLSETTVNFDLHLIGGIAGALLSSDSDDLSGFKFGPAIGVGMRFFFDGDMALNLELVDHMYSFAEVQREGAPPEEEFTHTVMFTLGVSFFVTGDLRVSR